MTLLEYQMEAAKTSLGTARVRSNMVCMVFGLVEEAGEVAGQMKRLMRDDNDQLTLERQMKMADELGDTLWYLTAVAHQLGITLEFVAQRNLAKLKVRALNDTIKGEGDR